MAKNKNNINACILLQFFAMCIWKHENKRIDKYCFRLFKALKPLETLHQLTTIALTF